MSGGERRIADTRGKFLQVVTEGRRIDDARWSSCRILLSNRRLILVGEGGKRTLPLSAIDSLGGRYDVNQAVARVSRYASLETGSEVVLLAADDHESFALDLYTALLAGDVVHVRHPAVEGGVVREAEWEKARVQVGDDGAVNVATTGGTFVGIEPEGVGDVAVAERSVEGESRVVVEVEHVEEGTSVETHLAGSRRSCSVLEAVLGRGLAKNSGEVDLDGREKQVLMALYSGISPFEIPEFTGVDVDEVEATFERLIELDVLEEVRVRREVSLTSRGRILAGRAIDDE